MTNRSNELNHLVPLTARVKLSFSRVDMKYDKNKKRTTFTYILNDRKFKNKKSPKFEVHIDDWDSNTNNNVQHELRKTVQDSLDQYINGMISSDETEDDS